MGYNYNRMKAIQKGASNKSYDSDKDLPEETQKEIKDKENHFDTVAADKLRKDSWEKAGMFPKLGKMVKSAFSGDMREKTPEEDQAMEQEMARRKRLYGSK